MLSDRWLWSTFTSATDATKCRDENTHHTHTSADGHRLAPTDLRRCKLSVLVRHGDWYVENARISWVCFSWYLSPGRSRWIDCGTETERQQERAFPCGPRLRTAGKRFATLKTVGVNPPRRTVGDMTMASERTLGGADHSSRSTGSGKNTLPRRHWPSLPWWGRETSPCHKRSCKDLRSPLRSARTKR